MEVARKKRRKIKDKGGEETEEGWVRTLGFAREHSLSVLPEKKEKNKEALINSYPP